MNYIKEAEEILKYYRDLNRSVDHMGYELAKLIVHNAPSHLSAISLDITGIHGSGGEDDNTYNVLYKIQVLSESREKTRAELEIIKMELEEIEQDPECENFGKVLHEWYILGTRKSEIKDILGYSSMQSVYGVRNKAIRKFAIRHFGLDAMKVVQ